MPNSSDIERLEVLNKKKEDLERKIELLSIYEVDVIADIIIKLMTSYEGQQYELKKDEHPFYDSEYRVSPIIDGAGPQSVLGFVSEMKHKDIKDSYKDKSICFLPPSGYLDIININCYVNNNYEFMDYVQKFIDYLYGVRSEEMLVDIDKVRLNTILDEFLENTKEEQQFRKEEIIKENIEKTEREQIRAFENLCLIDRTSIFDAITYVVNNYGDDMTAIQEKYSEWEKGSQCSTLTVYHKLSVKSHGEEVSFKTVVDSDERFPDEQHFAIVNYGKKTSICYFDLKRKLSSILNNNPYCIVLMGLIEDKYNETKLLTATDVEELLDGFKSNFKRKVKEL